MNPPPASGSLSTEPAGAIRIRNATVGDGAHPNAAAFWDTNRTFQTRSLRHDARYNEFRDAPELVYEHSVVAAEFDDAVLLRTGQTVVADDRISLTALTGSASESGIAPQSVDPRAVSASGTTIPLEPSAGNVTLKLPTAVENASALAARWNRALPATATATPNATGDALEITLDNGSDPYRLALSEVSLDASGTTEPAYIVSVGSETAAVGESVGVEVRDRYNNPVPDAVVSFGGENRTTGDDGRAFFESTASGPLTATINGTAGPTYESVSFDVSAGGGGGSVNRTYDVEWDEIEPVQVEEGTSEPLDILVSDADTGARIDGAAVDVGFAPIGTVSGPPSVPDPPETGSNGRTTVSTFDTNEASAGDNFTLYATSGDDVGRLVVEVVASGALTRLYPDTFTESRGSLSDFSNIQDENGNFAIFDGSGSNSFDVETTTQNVPAGSYSLELGVGTVDLQGSSTGVDVVVEDESGTQLGSTTLDDSDSNTVVTIGLSAISSQQDITVRYTGDRQNDDLEIDYQRLVE